MSRIKGRDTAPEMALRRALRHAGLGYRTGVRGLPGTPDVVMAGSGMAIFVHGCFWHRHPGCPKATSPRSSLEFWEGKFRANVARDRRVVERLKSAGWRVCILWECEAMDPEDLVLAVEAISLLRRDASSDGFRAMVLPRRSQSKRRTENAIV